MYIIIQIIQLPLKISFIIYAWQDITELLVLYFYFRKMGSGTCSSLHTEQILLNLRVYQAFRNIFEDVICIKEQTNNNNIHLPSILRCVFLVLTLSNKIHTTRCEEIIMGQK